MSAAMVLFRYFSHGFVSDAIRLNMESNQPTIVVLLDFSKALDSVCHGSLFILKLRQRYGFHDNTAAALVSSYLFPQYQKVGTMFLI
jgi:hypothetical protein